MEEFGVFLLEQYGPFMSIEELAHMVKLKKSTIYNQVCAGTCMFPCFKVGKRLLFPTKAVSESIAVTVKLSQEA